MFLRLVRREYFICRSSLPTVLRLTAIPNRLSCRAILLVVFLVHFSPLMGSPAVSLSISWWMASITAGVFFPPVCVLHPRPVYGPSAHPGPTVAAVLWPPCAGPPGEARRSGGRPPTAAIPGQRTNAVVARRAHWRTGQSPPAVHGRGRPRTQERLTPAALAAPATAAAAFEGCWRNTNISRKRSGGRSCPARPTAAGVP